MIAVTIAVGDQYERLAEAAAESCERFTGLKTHIIRQTPGESSPARYKLQLLRLFPGETVLCFDADARFLWPWDVPAFVDQPWPVVVLDWPSDARDEDCRQYGIAPSRYFASGLPQAVTGPSSVAGVREHPVSRRARSRVGPDRHRQGPLLAGVDAGELVWRTLGVLFQPCVRR